MTFVSGRMASQQQPVTETIRVRYTSGPRKHTKAGHVVTFSSQKSYVSTTSKDSSDEEEEYFNNMRRGTTKDSGGGGGGSTCSVQNFDVIKTLHEGKFSKILLAKLDGHGISKERMVLKAVEMQSASSAHMFYREMDYNYLLSPHENVVTSYNVVLRWKNYYIFAQEYAPAGDLGRYLKKFGALTEAKTKSVAKQLSSALDFVHGLNLVHQAVIPENILVFNRECTLIKLSDFCGMRPSGSLVMKGTFENCNEDDDGQQISSLLAYSPPEVCSKLPQEKYHVHPSIDVWAVGVIIWACLSGTGQGPWQSADMLRDPCFRQFYEWAKKKSLKVPDAFQPLSCRLLRLIKRLLEPKPEKRCKAREVLKYLKDEWLSSLSSKNTAAVLSRLGMSRSESCTFGVSGNHGGNNGGLSAGGGGGSTATSHSFSRACSQRYARRGSVCPRPKSEVRRAKRQESNNNSGNNNSGNNSSSNNSPKSSNKQGTQTQKTSRGTTSDPNSGFKISCVLETSRAVPLSTSKSATSIMPPPSPTPASNVSLPPMSSLTSSQKCP